MSVISVWQPRARSSRTADSAPKPLPSTLMRAPASTAQAPGPPKAATTRSTAPRASSNTAWTAGSWLALAARMTRGSWSSTRVWPGRASCALAPQGSKAARSGSAVTSACATLGEHTPSRRWGALSMPSLAFSVACMSTSLTMPICSAASAARRVSTASSYSIDSTHTLVLFFQPLDAQRLEHMLFIQRLGRAVLHLVHEVFLERHLGQVHPFALLEPVDVARRNLRQRHEGGAGIAHVGQADDVPGGLGVGALALQLGGDVVHDG